MRVEIGPVSRESAAAWLDYADRVVASLRGIEADKAPPEVLDAFESVLAEWREAMEEPGEFHWVSERPSEEVGFMLNALYEAGLAVEAAHEMVRVSVAAGGTLSGEHGIGLEKRDLMSQVFSADDLDAQARVRDAFDPDRRMNPGKVLPDGSRCFDRPAE